MKRFGLGSIAGLGVAGLLVAGTAYAQSGSTAGSQTTGPSQSGSTTSQGTGSTGSSSTAGTTSSPGTTEQHAMGKESGKNELTGTVEKFNRESKELTLQHSDKKLKVNDTTRVTKDGQRGSLSDIKEGDQVRASFSGTGDTLTVTRIDVMTAGSMGTGSTGSMSPAPGKEPGATGTGTTGTAPSGTTPSGTTPPPSKGY